MSTPSFHRQTTGIRRSDSRRHPQRGRRFMAEVTAPLLGKLALVTGAGMGIGQGIALELARQGADVAVHYAGSEQGARETVAQIEALGRRSVAIQGRLGEVEQCRRGVPGGISAPRGG